MELPYQVGDYGYEATLRIPQQSAEANARLVFYALLNAKDAVAKALNILDSAAKGTPEPTWGEICTEELLSEPFTDFGLPPGWAGSTPGEMIANGLTEAYHLFAEATERGVKLNVSAADNQRDYPEQSVAVARQVTGDALSRAAAAHLYVGGWDGLSASPLTAGMCTVGELSPPARRALDLFRKAGMCPRDILNRPGSPYPPAENPEPIEISKLVDAPKSLDGTDGYPSAGSVRERLVEHAGFDPDATFAERYAVSEAAFAEAREYLAQEILAFGRSLETQYTKDPGDSYAIFAAVRHPPRDPVAMYYATLARTTPGQVTLGTPPASPVVLPIQALTNQNVNGIGQAQVADIIHAHLSAISGDSDISSVQGTLHNLSQSLREDLKGRWHLCNPGPYTSIDSLVLGYSGNDGLKVVIGEEGLECAIKGEISGAPCKLSTDTVETENGTHHSATVLFNFEQDETSTEAEHEFGNATAASISGPDYAVPGQRVYLVKPKASDVTPGPGDYQALAGVVFPDQELCSYAQITPALSEEAGRLLAPSTSWCSHPELECDGSSFDSRLPLEDELSEDGDGVESSWKHYLALARQAAAEADLLAEEYIRSGLDLDLRTEELSLRERANQVAAVHELETLQTVCGTNVDPALLLEALSTDGEDSSFGSVSSGPCGPGATSCAPHEVCQAGQCLKTPSSILSAELAEKNPEVARLRRCLGLEGGTLDAITAGDRHLCYWRDPTDPNLICNGECNEPGCPELCPVPVASTGEEEECDERFKGPDGTTPLERTQGKLGFFRADDTGRGTKQGSDTDGQEPEEESDGEKTCRLVREMRQNFLNGVSSESEIADLVAVSHNWFDGELLINLADAISYRPEPGAFAHLTYAGAPWKTTGSFFSGATAERPGEWPCDDEDESCSDPESLFCEPIACDNVTDRAKLNYRLRDAVITLKLLTSGTAEIPDVLDADFVDTLEPDPTEFLPLSGLSNSFPDEYIAHTTRPDGHTDTGVDTWYVDTASNFILWKREERSLGTMSQTSPVAFFPRDKLAFPFRVGRVVAKLETELDCDAHAVFDGLSQRKPVRQNIHCLNWGSAIRRSLEGSGAKFERAAELRPDSGYSVRGKPEVFWVKGKWEFRHYSTFGTNFRLWEDVETDAWGASIPERFSITTERALDAMELACHARLHKEGKGELFGCDFNPDVPLNVHSVDDLVKVSQQLRCIADGIEGRTARTLLPNFPQAAFDALRSGTTVGSYPEFGGEYSEALSAVRAALIEIHASGPLISGQVNSLAFDIEDIRAAFKVKDAQVALNSAIQQRDKWNQITECATAAGGLSPARPGSFVVAAATCLNTAIQVSIGDTIKQIEDDLASYELDDEILDARRRFTDRATALAEIADDLLTAHERMDAALARLENIRQQALRSLQNAVWLQSFEAEKQYNINAALRNRFQTASVRYEEAHALARKLAVLARRSIEARLGERLEAMTEDLPLVEAPSSWANSICTSTPLDYSRFSEPLTSDGAGQEGTSFAEAYVGRYVTRLESVVESYRLSSNFHEGTDTAIVSLRDDVFGVRAECAVPQKTNLVAASGDLTSSAWQSLGCEQDESGAPLPGCVWIAGLHDGPAPVDTSLVAPPPGYLVTFGPSPTPEGDARPCEDCGLNAGTFLGQGLALAPGDYLLSWYSKQFSPGGSADDVNPSGANSVRLLRPDGTVAEGVHVKNESAGNDWVRRVWRYSVNNPVDEAQYGVGIIPAAVGGATQPHQVLITGISVESARNTDEPSDFVSTNEDGTVDLPACEDTTGKTFRNTRWNYACMNLCEEGISGSCNSELAREVCYWEASFYVNQRSIEIGEKELLSSSGFAIGNFNYRIEDLAVNFVGTDVRKCDNSDTPQACYSGGFVPYSIVHEGPYYVRNRQGEDFNVSLFTGNIEHARGLATERYITNPISDSDRGLLADYMRSEFQGRPLDGNFVVRVWDDGSFNWDAIQDVQLILKYRYWTRFD